MVERVLSLPCWRGMPRAERLAGGLSNAIWKVTDRAGLHVARLGPDYPVHHVDRAREAMTARAAHRAGLGPAVEYTAAGVMVTEFLNAEPLTAADLRAEPERIAALLLRFHHEMPAEVSGPGFAFWPFHVIRDYLRALPDHDPDERRAFALIAAETEAAQVPLPIVFGHHDLLPANILDDGGRLWLIDYEYAGWGTAMFDLANAASNAGMAAAEADRLLAAYFGSPPDPALRRAFDAMQVASLLRETLWALVSARHLAGPGVDYLAYAAENRARLSTSLAAWRARQGELP